MPGYERLGGDQSCWTPWSALTSLEKKLVILCSILGIIIFSLCLALAMHKCDELNPIPTTQSPTPISTSSTSTSPNNASAAPSSTSTNDTSFPVEETTNLRIFSASTQTTKENSTIILA